MDSFNEVAILPGDVGCIKYSREDDTYTICDRPTPEEKLQRFNQQVHAPPVRMGGTKHGSIAASEFNFGQLKAVIASSGKRLAGSANLRSVSRDAAGNEA